MKRRLRIGRLSKYLNKCGKRFIHTLSSVYKKRKDFTSVSAQIDNLSTESFFVNLTISDKDLDFVEKLFDINFKYYCIPDRFLADCN